MSTTILTGHCMDHLRSLPEKSVHCCVTSPPYWGLRDYGLEPVIWPPPAASGTPDTPVGQPPCPHVWGDTITGPLTTQYTDATGNKITPEGAGTQDRKRDRPQHGQWCQLCGAWRGCLGLEPTPDQYVQNIIAVFREVWRVLRDDGTLWLNMGDSYTSGGRSTHGTRVGNKQQTNRGSNGEHDCDRAPLPDDLKPKDLIGIPWRVALALQADGWYLRAECIWCLSGGTYVYARTQKGEQVCMVRDLARLDPATVELWNGEKWTRLLGMSKSPRKGDELEITLMSGERVACTPSHKWPTNRGLLAAGELQVGDVIQRATLPEPDEPRDCALDEDAAWFAGLYIAEGSRSNDTIQISGHAREEGRWERIQRIARKFGGSATRTVAGNTMNIRLHGKVLAAILDELVTGRVARDKGFAPVVWRYSNRFLAAMVDGYLHGDGHFDQKNNRWRLGFTRNYNLERDLRAACARLGYKLSLKLAEVPYNGRMVKAFRGEVRMVTSGHHNEHDTGEIVKIGKAKCREVYDLGVEDEPHLFALASGLLTHNSKPNCMPESCTDRPTRQHEQVFLLTKKARYYYDAEAVKEAGSADSHGGGRMHEGRYMAQSGRNDGGGEEFACAKPAGGNGRNLRTVWEFPTAACPDAHFATFPEELPRRCILAGTSERGACPECGAPWRRIVEKTTEPDASAKGSRFDQGKTAARDGGDRTQPGDRLQNRTVGWVPGCKCGDDAFPLLPPGEGRGEGAVPCTVLDPFLGAGTTLKVAADLLRDGIGIEANPEYVKLAEKRIGLRLDFAVP